jgi:hypothetical protein
VCSCDPISGRGRLLLEWTQVGRCCVNCCKGVLTR